MLSVLIFVPVAIKKSIADVEILVVLRLGPVAILKYNAEVETVSPIANKN
jgi:hypothetical protein